jgi:hypothetical protein
MSHLLATHIQYLTLILLRWADGKTWRLLNDFNKPDSGRVWARIRDPHDRVPDPKWKVGAVSTLAHEKIDARVEGEFV